MKILSPQQLKEAEIQTIKIQGIEMIDLMERAANAVLEWIKTKLDVSQNHFTLICGVGNNGGDGLALARLLTEEKSTVKVYLQENNQYSLDNLTNQKRLKATKVGIERFNADTKLELPPNTVIIDCIFGYGLNRSIDEYWHPIIKQINEASNVVISLDVPSGLFCNQINEHEDLIVKSDITLTFQTPKLGLLLSDNQEYVSDFEILDIGLDEEAMESQNASLHYVTKEFVFHYHMIRNKFTHKGEFGHALVIGGSYGKIGANLLSTRAALKSGCGMVTSYVPKCGYTVLQSAFAEAMVMTDFSEDIITKFPPIEKYDAIAIGSGMGTNEKTKWAFEQFLDETDFSEKSLILDADAINLLSQNQNLLKKLPEHTVLTPHHGELRRLVGDWKNDYERLEKTKQWAVQHKFIIVSKGGHTAIFAPQGEVYFNSTGNAGMATAGSGDVLAGIITGIIAKGFEPLDGAIFGVYLHGLCGDLAKEHFGEESLLASDIINFIPLVYKQIFG